MLSPLVSFRSPLHQTYCDHVSEQTSLAARSILRPDPLHFSEQSSEHSPRASPLPLPRREAYDSPSIRTCNVSSNFALAFTIRTSLRSTVDHPTNYPIVNQQSKNKDQGESVESSDKDRMAPKSGHYESSHSSMEGERVTYNPRREDRERSAASNTKKRTVVVTYGGKTGDPARTNGIDGKHWK